MQIKKEIRKKLDAVERVWRVKGEYFFEDRRKQSNVLFYILAGYKEFLWNNIFKRVHKYIPTDADICILSSGIYSEKLSAIAANYGWSYLGTKKNNIPLAQNILITKYDKAKWVFKMDEDIFITPNYYETMLKTYMQIENYDDYKIGFLAPLIPLNSFGHIELLKELNLKQKFTDKFGQVKYGWNIKYSYYSNPEVAKFWWGGDGKIPKLERVNEMMQNKKIQYAICPIMFNIGAILFKREFWLEMDMFKVPLGNGLGIDEDCINIMTTRLSKPAFVAKNVVVGHLAFTPQFKVMKDFYLENPELFAIE